MSKEGLLRSLKEFYKLRSCSSSDENHNEQEDFLAPLSNIIPLSFHLIPSAIIESYKSSSSRSSLDLEEKKIEIENWNEFLGRYSSKVLPNDLFEQYFGEIKPQIHSLPNSSNRSSSVERNDQEILQDQKEEEENPTCEQNEESKDEEEEEMVWIVKPSSHTNRGFGIKIVKFLSLFCKSVFFSSVELKNRNGRELFQLLFGDYNDQLKKKQLENEDQEESKSSDLSRPKESERSSLRKKKKKRSKSKRGWIVQVMCSFLLKDLFHFF